MTDLLSPEDTGEIPMIDTLGTEATRDLREHRRDTTGEHTRNLAEYVINAPSFDAIPRKVFDLDDTVTYMPQTIGIVGLEGPQKPPPPLPKPPRPATPPTSLLTAAGEQDVADWERIVETDRLSILESLTATVDGEMVPLPRPIPPTVPVPPAPPKPSYRGRHRLTVAGRWRRLPWQARGFAQLGLIVTAVCALWWVMS